MADARSFRAPIPSMPQPASRAAVRSAPQRRSWLQRLFGVRQPSTFQRCLAVHMHYAAPHRELH